MPLNPKTGEPGPKPTHDIAPRYAVVPVPEAAPRTAAEAVAAMFTSNDPETTARIADYAAYPNVQLSVAGELAKTLHPHLFEPAAPMIDLMQARQAVAASFDHQLMENV